jgi:hypothetical protein
MAKTSNATLVIIPCGQSKVWDRFPDKGPTKARTAYTGVPFKVNMKYAERLGGTWLILSAKYGFVTPDFLIPGPYNVTFKKKNTKPITTDTLRQQIVEQRLDSFDEIIGLGGKEYREAIEAAFSHFGMKVSFPFGGLNLFDSMKAISKAGR